MAYTATQLVSDAYYASGIVSRDFEQPSGSQNKDGLREFNYILSDKTVDSSMLAYNTSYSFNTVIGQESYAIPDLITVDTLTFTLDNVRYPLSQVKKNQYFGNVRANSVSSLPYQFHIVRDLAGANLYMYFLPNAVYTMELWGSFSLSSVTGDTDLELTHDLFYISYMKNALAARLCSVFNVEVPMGVSEELRKYYQWIQNRSAPLDLTMRKISTLSGDSTINYGEVNLGNGWGVGDEV